jgi:predicted DNA-binding transcriptional regulator AlpA
VVGLYAAPRLEELVADPDKLGVLDPRTRRALTTTALAALNTLMFNELALAAEPSGSISLDRRDRLLDFKQAAEKLGVTADWLYHNYKDLPFWLRVGRRPRFSENGIEAVHSSIFCGGDAAWSTGFGGQVCSTARLGNTVEYGTI